MPTQVPPHPVRHVSWYRRTGYIHALRALPRKKVSDVLKAIVLSLLLVTAASTAFAQDAADQPAAKTAVPEGTNSIHLDPARTTIEFSAGSFRRVHGTFQLKGGVFALDSKSGIAQGEILADPSSEKSNDARLDDRIRKETLESEKYPGMFFHPEKVSGTLPAKDGEGKITLTGSFNIHGSDHPLTVDVDTVKAGDDYTFKTTFNVPYVDWGMKDASTTFMRARIIRITMESHGTVESLHPKT